MTHGTAADEQQHWGPQKLENGQIRFQLWASAETVIRLRSGETDLPMQRFTNGWHRLDANVPVGESYAFVLSEGRRSCVSPATRWCRWAVGRCRSPLHINAKMTPGGAGRGKRR